MAGKKIKGEGTIVQLEKDKPKGKCRKWQLRVSTGKDPRTGKYKTKTRRFSGTYTQAAAALREFIAEIEDDRVATRAGTTFKECADDFLAHLEASGNFTACTNESYRALLGLACDHLGYAEVTAVGVRELEAMYAAMRSGDTRSGRRMSGTTLHLLHKTVRLMLDDLVEAGVLLVNPCRKMETPKRDTKERRALSPERIRALVAELDCESEPECAYFLAVTMGLRRGEVCGLSWADVDFVGGVLDVRHSYDHFGNLKQPKTKAGCRRLPMPGFVADALRRHKAAQAQRLAGMADKSGRPLRQTDDTAVVLGLDGARMNPNSLAARWKGDRGALGVDGWCLHELRHSYLTMLAMEGVHPKVMQELAGHSSSKTTMDIYMHVNMSQKLCAADAIEAVVAGVGPEAPKPVEPPAAMLAPSDLKVIPGGAARRARAPEQQAADA